MLRLAEEVGLVGGQDVDEMRQFRFEPCAAKEKIATFGKARHLQIAQPPAQTRFDHGLFGGMQPHADFGANEIDYAGEVPV
ncbi:hypothetical protein ASG47_02660 [Devosia sp. Leaf420]|nr:hypothetical protein ASG47_02660 [Devosia sp. Leaf420]